MPVFGGGKVRDTADKCCSEYFIFTTFITYTSAVLRPKPFFFKWLMVGLGDSGMVPDSHRINDLRLSWLWRASPVYVSPLGATIQT